MRYCIIGLGIYGSNLARDLTQMGHEVIGADSNSSNVDAIKDHISTAYIIDSTDEQSLGALPLRNVDVVIVAIGENFGASVKTVAILKKMGIKHIYARAIDTLHESILESFKVDRILTPEQRAAWDLVNEMELGSKVQALSVADDNFVLQFRAPSYFVGMKYADLNLEHSYGLSLIAAATLTDRTNVMGLARSTLAAMTPDEIAQSRVEEGDQFTCYGSRKAFRALFRHIN